MGSCLEELYYSRAGKFLTPCIYIFFIHIHTQATYMYILFIHIHTQGSVKNLLLGF